LTKDILEVKSRVEEVNEGIIEGISSTDASINPVKLKDDISVRINQYIL